MVGVMSPYKLGTGDYHPRQTPGGVIDVPWTERDGVVGSDCAGFAISWCHQLKRHRPGFNHGAWATVSDDLNTDSCVEDARHKRELFEEITRPEPGCLLVYKSIRLPDHAPPYHLIGHVAIVLEVPAEWDPAHPQYELLTVAQCKGPNRREPAVVKTDGSVWSHHDSVWSKPEHRSVLVRVISST